MKTIKLLAISMLLMSFSCSTDETERELQQDCDCVTTIYRLPVGSSTYTWYQTGLPDDDELTCDDAMEIPLYYSAPNFFYQVTCE